MSDLPKGWALSTLGDLGEWSSGGTPSRKNSEYYGGSIPWVKTGDLNDNYIELTEEFITEIGLKNSSAKIFPFGTLLLAMYGATIGKTGILKFDAATNQACAAILAKGLTTQIIPFLRYFLIYKASDFKDIGQGGAQPNISQAIIKQFPILLPPLAEQKRIVEKLDKLFAHTRRAREKLDRIPKLIERYKQAILSAAISEDFQKNWEKVDIQTVAKVGTGSTPLKSNSDYYSQDGTPWITSASTGQLFVTTASDFVTESAILDHRLKKYPIGTLLVAMYGEGKTRGQVTELAIEATINQACAAIIVDESLAIKDYVKLSLQANYIEMRELAEGGNQPNLNLSKIKNFPLYLPSLQEQEEIVKQVEKYFEKIDHLEQEYQKAVKFLDRLEQTTLAKAFRGELVPQDPNDEPASVLLERIQQEKNAQTPPKKRKAKKTTQQTELF